MAILQEFIPLDKMFVLFSKAGDEKSDGTRITLRRCDFWLKQANVIDKKLTTTVTGLCFFKFKKSSITYPEFLKYLDDLAKTTKKDIHQMKDQLTMCGMPEGF